MTDTLAFRSDHVYCKTGYNAAGQCVDVFVISNGRLGSLVLNHWPEGDAGTPTFSLRDDAAQNLMDRLWFCGFRPSEGSGSAGALAATQRHLDDMRQITFNQLNMEPPCQTKTKR